MMPNQSFGKLLEDYAFSVAANFMDLVDTESQTQLIQFINQIEPADSSPARPVIDGSPLRAGSFMAQIEAQCQEALRLSDGLPKSTSPAPISFFQRLSASRQASIVSTIDCMNRMDTLLERAKQMTIQNKFVVDHYQKIRNGYAVRLMALQQQELLVSAREWTLAD